MPSCPGKARLGSKPENSLAIITMITMITILTATISVVIILFIIIGITIIVTIMTISGSTFVAAWQAFASALASQDATRAAEVQSAHTLLAGS